MTRSTAVTVRGPTARMALASNTCASGQARLENRSENPTMDCVSPDGKTAMMNLSWWSWSINDSASRAYVPTIQIQNWIKSSLEPIPVDEYIPCWRPSEVGTALIVVAWLATRPPHALSALLMRSQQKTLPTGIGF